MLARAGHRCEVVIVGVRCTATLGLEAHHVVDLVDGGGNDPDNGRAVCRRHHRLLEKRGS
ncbi:MAG: HNH endonuclease [Solirubrobacterales bacterium]|nr:HNH endonuclease [Solirubrobacterales bacterium]